VLHALHFGRIDPIAVHGHLRLPREVVDLPSEFLALTSAPSPEQHLDAAEPPYVHYALLKRALSAWRAKAQGERTVQAQVDKIELTLERWRWVPHQFTTTPIIVNIPAFRLYALSPNSDREAEMLRMDVVVGSAYSHRTPVFSDALEHIIFAPYWDVPQSIAIAELLPLARRDPHVLTVNHYQIVSTAGTVLRPTRAALESVRTGAARIRQLPGGGNALGAVKFVFPNAFNVYLHDTPVQSAFARERRDLSHGCIRVARPFALAQWVLRDVAGWDSTAIAAAMQRSTPLRVDLPRPVPVHILYATAVAREDGTVLFYDDIYGLDAELERQLRRGYPYRMSLH
jgi:L,D-transpeptidase YcbB